MKKQSQWIGIGRSVGVCVSGEKIIDTIWNNAVDADVDAVGLIHEYADEYYLEITCKLPDVPVISPLPQCPATAKMFFEKHDIQATPEEIAEFQAAMDANKKQAECSRDYDKRSAELTADDLTDVDFPF